MPIVDGQQLPYPPAAAPAPAAVPPAAAPPGAGAPIGPGQAPGIGDPREQVVASFVQERVTALTPEERTVIGRAMTPEFAAVMLKILGNGVADLVGRAQSFNGAPAGPGQLAPSAPAPTGIRAIG